MNSEIKVREAGLLRIALTVLCVVAGFAATVWIKSGGPLAIGLLSALIAFFIGNMKFEDLFLVQESPVFDPKSLLNYFLGNACALLGGLEQEVDLRHDEVFQFLGWEPRDRHF